MHQSVDNAGVATDEMEKTEPLSHTQTKRLQKFDTAGKIALHLHRYVSWISSPSRHTTYKSRSVDSVECLQFSGSQLVDTMNSYTKAANARQLTLILRLTEAC